MWGMLATSVTRRKNPCESGERKAESGVGFPSQTGGQTFLSARGAGMTKAQAPMTNRKKAESGKPKAGLAFQIKPEGRHSCRPRVVSVLIRSRRDAEAQRSRQSASLIPYSRLRAFACNPLARAGVSAAQARQPRSRRNRRKEDPARPIHHEEPKHTKQDNHRVTSFFVLFFASWSIVRFPSSCEPIRHKREHARMVFRIAEHAGAATAIGSREGAKTAKKTAACAVRPPLRHRVSARNSLACAGVSAAQARQPRSRRNRRKEAPARPIHHEEPKHTKQDDPRVRAFFVLFFASWSIFRFPSSCRTNPPQKGTRAGGVSNCRACRRCCDCDWLARRRGDAERTKEKGEERPGL